MTDRWSRDRIRLQRRFDGDTGFLLPDTTVPSYIPHVLSNILEGDLWTWSIHDEARFPELDSPDSTGSDSSISGDIDHEDHPEGEVHVDSPDFDSTVVQSPAHDDVQTASDAALRGDDDDSKAGDTEWDVGKWLREKVPERGPDIRDRFNALKDSTWRSDDEPSYAPDHLLLGFRIHVLPNGYRYVQLSPWKSALWHDRRHLHEPPEGDYALPWEDPSDGKGAEVVDKRQLELGWSLRRYQLCPLDLESWEFRLLFLSPDHGDEASPLSGKIVKSWMSFHSCYTAVRHSRGNPSLKGAIILDGQTWEITKNLESFLRLMRLPWKCRVLWVRELCIDKCNEDEYRQHFNWMWQKMIESCSCGIIQVNEVMDELEDLGLLEKPLNPRPKLWDSPVYTYHHPIHFPVRIGRHDVYENDQPAWTYEHLPLDLVADEIRLVVLHGAPDYSSPLRADIAHVPLHGDFEYYALSYTWGEGEAKRRMNISGQLMWITENLDAALRALRDGPETTRKIKIWIDAICIDQSSNQEKDRQIPRMHNIYNNAVAVIAWTGPNTKLIQTGMSFVKELTQPKITVFDVDETGEPTVLKATPRLARAWWGLYEVLRQPFFRRQWIVQELACANLPNVVPAGGRTFHWQKLPLAADMFENHLEDILKLWRNYYTSPLDAMNLREVAHEEETNGLWKKKASSPLASYKELAMAEHQMRETPSYEWGLNDVWVTIRSVKILTYIRHLRATDRSPSFLLLLLLTQTFDCRDPRDKIYALWNLANDSEHLGISLNYSQSTAAIYMDFTKAYATYHRSLDIICATQFSFQGASTPLVPGPEPDYDLRASWCPDWRRSPHLNTFVRRPLFVFNSEKVEEIGLRDRSLYHADRMEDDGDGDGTNADKDHRNAEDDDIKHPPFTFEGTDLLASGAIIDTVAHISDWPIDWFPMRRISDDWRALIFAYYRRPDGSVPSMADTEATFWSMVVGEPSGRVTASLTAEDHYSLQPEEEMLPPHVDYDWRYLLRQTIKGRKLIITEKGYMGLAPWYVRVGFRIAVLLGCSVPVVLEEIRYSDDEERESGYTEGLYFRGDCFIQDWMHGEMMRQFGKTNEDAWKELIGRERLRIH